MENNRQQSAWVAGLVLVGLGVFFLLQNLTGVVWGNWWAVFILIPAFWAFWSAWQAYVQDRAFTRRVANLAYGGMFPLLVAVLFLFNLDWGRMWPLFLILAGLGAITGWNQQPKPPRDSTPSV